MNRTLKQRNQRRYYLHWKLRQIGVNVMTKERTISVSITETELGENKHLRELKNKFNYAIQLAIPNK